MFSFVGVAGPALSQTFSPLAFVRLARSLIALGVVTLALGTLVAAGYVRDTLKDLPHAEETLQARGVAGTARATHVYSRDGEWVGRIGVVEREPMPLSAMGKWLPKALIAAEDQNFYSHHGVDFVAIARAALRNLQHPDRRPQGASTITQQLVKMLSGNDERTFTRKLREMAMAIQLEDKLPKDRILEAYLNAAYFGRQAYGPAAAADIFFNKPPVQLTIAEAAYLAGALKAPSALDPDVDYAAAKARRTYVIDRMLATHMIDPTEADVARNAPLPLSASGSAADAVDTKPDVAGAGYVMAAVRRELPGRLSSPGHAVDVSDIAGGGLDVETTVDPKMQRAAVDALRAAVDRYRARFGPSPAGDPVEASLIVLDARTGAIRALVGGRDYENQQFDRALLARRQPGSAFKFFVYLAAFEKGFIRSSPVLDMPIEIDVPGKEDEVWRPENYTRRSSGMIPLERAFALSKNLAAIRLYRQVGPEAVNTILRDFDLPEIDTARTGAAAALGVQEMTPAEMASAYAGVINGGTVVHAHILRSASRGGGNAIDLEPGVATLPLKPSSIDDMKTLLREVVTSGTASRVFRDFPVTVYGKTGTSNAARDNWFVGGADLADGPIAFAAWVGYDHPASLGDHVSGGAVAAPIVKDFLSRLALGAPE